MLDLLSYVSSFPDQKYFEDILIRYANKDLIYSNPNKALNYLKENEKEIYNNNLSSKNLLRALKILLIGFMKEKIFLEKVDEAYLTNIYFNNYKKAERKEKCSSLLFDFEIFRRYKSDDFIIEETKSCICFEKFLVEAFKFEIELINNKIKGTDDLIRDFILKEKDLKAKRFQEILLEKYLNGDKVKYEEIDFKYFENKRNLLCE
jgi:hypothetical protein